MYLAFATDCIGFPLSFKESGKVLSDIGYDGFWFNIERDSEISATETKELLEQYNMRPTGCNLPVDFRIDEASFKKDLEQLKGYAKYAEEVGIDRTMTWIVPGSETLDYNENFKLHHTRLAEIATVLEVHGIKFGLEFVGPLSKRLDRKFPFIHNLEGILSLVDAVGKDNVGLLLDVWHWDLAGQTRADFTRLCAEKIVLVHLNDAPKGLAPQDYIDNDRRLTGTTGVLRLGEFMDGLNSLGYDGPAVVEPFYQPLAEMPFPEAAKEVYETAMKVWK